MCVLNTRRWILVVLVIAIMAATTASADEDVFETDNFLDPRSLGAEMEVDKPTTPGNTFKLFNSSAGFLGNYQDRTTFTGEKRRFVNVDYLRYWSDWQLSGGVTFLDYQTAATTRRAKLSLGRYSLNQTSRKSEDDFIARWLLSAVVDDRLGSSTEYEVTTSMFVELPLLLARSRGGGSLSYRGGGDSREVRFLWNSSADFWHFPGEHGRANGAFWVGYEHVEGHSRFTPIKLRLLVEYRLINALEIHAAYAPAYRFSSAGLESKFNNEWMVSLYYPFGAMVGQ